MSFDEFITRYLLRKYRLWVINTPMEAQLYLWINYKLLHSHIDRLLNISPEKAFIRSSQVMEGKAGFLSFGRMSWTKANNEKWTKKYREGNHNIEKVIFYQTQIWAPDWNVHCDTGVPPDVFVEIYNFNHSDIREGVIIAIPDRIYKKNSNHIDAAIGELAKAIPESTLSMALRAWNPGGGFLNQIQDINPREIAQIVKKQNEYS